MVVVPTSIWSKDGTFVPMFMNILLVFFVEIALKIQIVLHSRHTVLCCVWGDDTNIGKFIRSFNFHTCSFCFFFNEITLFEKIYQKTYSKNLFGCSYSLKVFQNTLDQKMIKYERIANSENYKQGIWISKLNTILEIL